MRLGIKEIASCLGIGADGAADVIIDGVATDSRQATPGCLFVCLPGKRVDSHDYAQQAVAQGCAAILARRPVPGLNVPVLVVADTEKALARLAALARSKTRAKVVCITGTAGKTTLKDTLRAIMSRVGDVAATEGNHNNQIGMPLTILNARGDEDFWILEAGISHAGDMELLGDIARPDLAVILNVGPGHTEGLGRGGVAQCKAKLLSFLAPGGRALVSADYPELLLALSAAAEKPLFFSTSKAADFRLLEQGDGWQRVLMPDGDVLFHTPFPDSFGGETVLAAAGAAALLGAPAAETAKGFAEVQLPPNRYRDLQLRNGVHLIDDTYNANPLSMSRSLHAASKSAKKRGQPFYAVLGAMGELGQDAAAWHCELGRELAAMKPAALFWKGPYADDVRTGLKGSIPLNLAETPESLAAAWRLHNLPRAGFSILFKGSRANKLENHVAAFRSMLEADGDN